jgi:hypothetical protein
LNQRGQGIVEYILLMVVLFGVFTAVIDFLKTQEFATKFTEGPWKVTNGMIQCGTWSPCGVEAPAAGQHPNAGTRVLSLDPQVSF